MADYPAAVYSPRTKEDLPGYPYDPLKKYIGYAEDIIYLENEVLAMIADMVGTGVAGGLKGAYGNLSLRLAVHDAMIPSSYLDTDGTLAANSDSKVATQKATKTYVDGKSAASSTDNAIAKFDGTTGDLQNSGVTIDDSNNVHGIAGLQATGAGSFATIKAGGAQGVKIYIYEHTLDAADIANTYCIITIASIDRTKVFGMSSVGYDVSQARVDQITDTANVRYTFPSVQTATDCRIYFGTLYVVGDTLRVTIIEAP